jgi:alpha-tubulin suppressor-like RCC1 family protein
MAACGSCHAFALTTEGSLYSWGLNLKGQLGLGTYENAFEPTLINSLIGQPSGKNSVVGTLKTQRPLTRNSSLLRKGTTQNIKENTEAIHTLLSQRSYSAEKKLFSQSMESKKSLKNDNDNSGSPLEQTSNTIPTTTLLSLREKIVEVACGSLHTVVRTNCRRILSAGYGNLYALGHKETDTINTFKPISYFTERNIAAVKIACGANSSACIAQEGTTFLWGIVSYSSPDKPIAFKTPTRLPFDNSAVSADGKSTPFKNTKSKQPAGAYNSQKRATDIKMGDGFAIILTESGAVYAFGANYLGQLGSGDFANHEFAVRVKGLPNSISQIACGNEHCLAIDNEYSLYSWGSNNYGQLGDEEVEDKRSMATKIGAFDESEVFKVACGSFSSFCLSYGKPNIESAKPKKEQVVNEESKKEIKNLQSEVQKLRLELAIKSELQGQKAAKGKSNQTNKNLPTGKLSGWRPCFEIEAKDLIYEEKITEGGYGIVYLGKWHETRVAIKQIKMEYVTQDKLEEFLSIH